MTDQGPPQSPARRRTVRLAVTMAVVETPLIVAGIVAYMLTDNWLLFGLFVGAGLFAGVVAILRFVSEAVRDAPGEVGEGQPGEPAGGNPPIVQ
jgi:hypothetical protein